MKKILQIIIFGSILLLGNFNGNAQTDALDEKIAAILEKHQVPGAAIALVNKDTVVYSGYFGKSDVEKETYVDAHTRFTIGSISKTFLALGVMIAQEQQALNISSPLKEWVPAFNFTNKFSYEEPLKLIHLLEHTSGFDEAHFDIFARADARTPFKEVLDKSRSALSTRWTPGSYYTYNTLNYIAAAYVLEESVKSSFETFMNKNVLKPLEIDGTYHPNDHADFSKGYSNLKEEPFPSLPQWPAGSLTTNLEGMQNFTQLFLNEGTFKGNKLVASTSIHKMETPESSQLAINGVDFGYGKGLMQEFVGNTVFFGHNGSYGGFLSEFGYSRKLNLGYVILINDREGSKAIKEIKRALLTPYKLDVAQSTPHDNSDFIKWEGAYQPTTFNIELLYPFMRLIDLQIIDSDNHQINQTSMLGGSISWIPTDDGKFRKVNDPKSSSLFMEEDGAIVWLGETSYRKISKLSAYIQFYLAFICIVGLIMTFFISGISLLRKLILKKPIQKVSLLPFLAILFLVIAISGLVFLYDPEKLYSPGAVVYYLGSWLFLIFSVWSFYYFIRFLLKKIPSGKWMRFQVGISSVACIIIASYLLYWGLIGLKLWNY